MKRRTSKSSLRSPEAPPRERVGSQAEPHLGSVVDDDPRGRDRFDGPELAIVLSHYDLGVIHSIKEFLRGSRRSPKVRITSGHGRYLLKRRAAGRDDPERVAFAHDLQRRLEREQYPVAGLIPVLGSHASMLRWGGHVYEMFHFVEGTRDDQSEAAAAEAGRALGRLHRIIADYRHGDPHPDGTYHDAFGIDAALRRIPEVVGARNPAVSHEAIASICSHLGEAYHHAAERAEAAGLGTWPQRAIHGDWHPGNLLFLDGRVVGVIDFDSARMAPRLIDVANGALQFSMIMNDPDEPDRWPDGLDVKRMRALLAGYDHESDAAITPGEREALPWLILEALILESVIPIADTGRFARLDGAAFLRMTERKVRWLKPRTAKLVEFLGEQ
ncbi:MAG: phosphotransferase [Planctomycetes bacterium]|nr:phosphotransferase [Planctomycetota bacterium]